MLALYGLVDDRPEPEPLYGQYPRGLIAKMLPWLRCARHEILHVCSGALPPGEGIRVDIRPEAHPDIVADGRALPLADGSVAAVMLDPPYSKEYARSLYGIEYPLPSHLLAEAARVVRPGGRIAFVHYITAKPALHKSVRDVDRLQHADARDLDLRARPTEVAVRRPTWELANSRWRFRRTRRLAYAMYIEAHPTRDFVVFRFVDDHADVPDRKATTRLFLRDFERELDEVTA